MRTFGIEEEFLLVDPASGLPGTEAAALVAALGAPADPRGGRGQAELLTCQIEGATGVSTSLGQAREALLDFRHRIGAAAAAAGLAVAGTGAAPLLPVRSPAATTGTPRYRRIGEITALVGAEQYVNGTHVHVGIQDREEGVRILNGLRPWLGTLAALAANSPFWQGRDSGFASWRLVHYRRWSVQGCPPWFADAGDYARRLAALTATDVVLDAGHVGWAARLSAHLPTVEVRVADAQLEAADSLLLAALIRALVSTVAEDPSLPSDDGTRHAPELLDVGLWQAARYGLDGNLVDHREAGSGQRAAAVQLHSLMRYVSPALRQAGDLDFVSTGIRRVEQTGTGARRQRLAAAQGGLAGLHRLYAAALAAP